MGQLTHEVHLKMNHLDCTKSKTSGNVKARMPMVFHNDKN